MDQLTDLVVEVVVEVVLLLPDGRLTHLGDEDTEEYVHRVLLLSVADKQSFNSLVRFNEVKKA